jgi:Arc/MetJ-type ribon-helix-helix transcriptional regulator
MNALLQRAHKQSEALRQMQDKERFNNIKLKQLQDDIQAGIASGDAGTLDIDEIKRRSRAKHAANLRETQRQFDADQEQAID